MSKDNYWLVSVLANLWTRRFERPLFKQLSSFFDKIFSDTDIDKSFGTLLTDLSMALDCVFFKKRKQRVKISASYGTWKDILSGFQQNLILGPL